MISSQKNINARYSGVMQFKAEQIGASENELKYELVKLFETEQQQLRAYLTRVKYENSKDENVALCISNKNGEDKLLINKMAEVFKLIFGADEFLDFIFITTEQEFNLRKVCCPFFNAVDYKYDKADFYLKSSEGYGLEIFRACYKVKNISGHHPDGYMLCDIDPPIIGQNFGLGKEDIHQIIITSRHEGYSIFAINEWPVYVHVARSVCDDIQNKDFIDENDIDSIAWAEIYNEKS